MMEKLVAQFTKHISDAAEIAQNSDFSRLSSKKFSQVVICGMGGSGIGGDLVAKWFSQEAKTPILTVKDYNIPGFIDENTLVIGSSYSGNTEETMTAIRQAAARKATIVGVCSGGELHKFCKENNYEHVLVPGGNPPRSMLAFSLIQLVNILTQANIISAGKLERIEKSKSIINKELISIKEQARKLADLVLGHQLVTYTSTEMEAVAVRCRQQMNENAKILNWHHVLPEMNHNELVGWGNADDHYAVLFLGSKFLSKRKKARFELSREIMSKKTPNIMYIEPVGESIIEETIYLIHLVDWASLYVAQSINQDPVEVNVIDYLKVELAKT